MSGAATFDERVAAFGAAHRLEDAIEAAREALEKVGAVPKAAEHLCSAIEGMKAAHLECLRVSSQGGTA